MSYALLHYNRDLMKKFYKSLKWNRFQNLTEERMQELDNEAQVVRFALSKTYGNTPSFMCKLAELLLTERIKIVFANHSINLNFANDDELIYLFVKAVDSNNKFLEIATLSQSKEELINMSKKYFGIYDNVMITFELALYKRLEELKENKNVR